MQSHLISRRSLIKSSLIGLACSAAPAIRAAEKDDWTETYDVVIIGSGFAGLAAAYSALENGVKSVLVLEKMNVFGGNSCINGGQISLAGSGLQKSKGIKDSPKLMEEDMLRVGQRLNHPALVKAVVKESPACYDMMVKCGVKFADQVIRLGGHSAPRTIFAENYSGGGICVPMHNWLKERGVEFRNKSFCSAVLTDKDGVVRGVEVEGQYDFDKKTHKNTYKVQAVKGVIFATGGWGADNEFISASTPQYSTLESTSQKGATSESVRMLLGLGAMPVLLDIYQVGPWATPDEFGAGAASIFADYIFAEGIMVDARNGKRFVNELASRRERSEAEMKCVDQQGKPVMPFGFCSEKTTVNPPGFKASFREGTVKKFDTVEALAKFYGAPLEPLKQQIAEWNKMVAAGKDELFGRPLDRRVELKAPFYAMRFWPKLHYCMGGIGINDQAQVISTKTCKPIPHLYAAGEITGGVHGLDRLGSCSSTDCLVMGRIAGRSVAANL